VIGHRAAAGHAPENTLPALEKARALGLREVEVDLRMSRDGRLVLFHDGTLDEKTDLSGPVSDHALATLLSADIGSWFDRTHPDAAVRYAGTSPITPTTAFARHGPDFFWHLEIKGREPEIPARLVAHVRDAGLEESAMITAFDEAQLMRVRALAPGLPLCQLVHRTRPGRTRPGPDAVLESAAAHGFAMVGIAASELNAAHVERGHALGLEVRAFGVDDDALLARVIDLGADGATVDLPERAFALLEERRPAP
jgi:glycerophosphoryl diester phosphodiesterase